VALSQALTYLEPLLKESGAVVEHDLLPTITAEQYPITLLFQNLISNAVKYRDAARKPRVHISARHEGSGWVFSVSDNGIGIDTEHLESIFLPFKRLHKREHSGTGLGLAMCRRIVERYGGQIVVESTPGEGATFRFTVPDAAGKT
jgi:signal transduction histidine kinase